MCSGTRPAVVAATSNLFSFPPGAGSGRGRATARLRPPAAVEMQAGRASPVQLFEATSQVCRQRNPIELIDFKPSRRIRSDGSQAAHRESV